MLAAQLHLIAPGRVMGRAIGIRGFTLLELLVALAVAAILITIAAPSLSALMRRNEASATINELLYGLRLARNEAVARSLPVVICAGQTSCTGGTAWSAGWIVFVDSNADGAATGERILHRVTPIDGGFSLSGNAGSGTAGRVIYEASGFAPGGARTFTLCDTRGSAAPRGLVVSFNGRVRAADSSDLSCAA